MFPQVYLINILRNVRYAIPVERANFPNQWKRKNPSAMNDQSTRSAGYGSGQQRGGDCTSQGAGQLSATPQQDYGTAQGYGGGGGGGCKVNVTPAHKEGCGLPIKGGNTMGACISKGGPTPKGTISIGGAPA